MSCLAQESVWYELDYLRLTPSAAEAWQRTHPGADSALFHVRFTGTKSDYNYVAMTRFASYAGFEKSNTGEPRELVRVDVVRQIALAGTIDSKWISVNFIKSNRGMEQDRQNDEIQHWLPIHNAQLKSGREGYKGWFAAAVRWPTGANTEYDIVSGDASDAFELPEGGGQEAEVAAANSSTAQHGVTVRRELWERLAPPK